MKNRNRILSVCLAAFLSLPALPAVAAIDSKTTDDTGIPGWTLISSYSDSGIYIDRSENALGTASMKIVNKTAKASTAWVQAMTQVPIKEGATYRLVFEAMAKNALNPVWFQIDSRNVKDRVNINLNGATYSWRTFEYQYIAQDTANINIVFGSENLCDGLWIDNIKFYDVSDPTVNLISNGNFESMSGGPAEPVVTEGTAVTKESDCLFEKSITIDGDISDWDGIPMQEITSRRDIAKPIGNIISASTGYAYDENNFYLAIKVEDSIHFAHNENGFQYWQCDSVQFGIAEVGSKGFNENGIAYYESKDQVYKTREETNAAVTRKDGVTIYEIAVPWTQSFPEGIPDRVMFNTIVNNNDGDGRKYCLEVTSGIADTKDATRFMPLDVLKPFGDITKSINFPKKAGQYQESFADVTVSNPCDAPKTATVVLANSDFKKEIVLNPHQTQNVKVPIPTQESGSRTYEIKLSCEGLETSKTGEVEIYSIPTRDDYTLLKKNLDIYTKELKELIYQCETKGLVIPYEVAAYSVICRFNELIETEAENQSYDRMAEYNRQLTDIYQTAKENLTAYLSGSKKPLRVPQYVQSDRTVDGYSIYANTFDGEKYEKRPVFFVGLGHWEHAIADIPFFANLGMNITESASTNPNVGLVKKSPTYWKNNSWCVYQTPKSTVEETTEETASGEYSAKFLRPANTQTSYATIVQEIAVKPDTTYRYGVKAKGSGISTNAAHMTVGGVRTNIVDSDDWKSYDKTLETGHDQTTLTFVLRAENYIAGAVYMDDAYLIEEGTDRNLVKNGDFETLLPEDATEADKKLASLGFMMTESEEQKIRDGLELATNNNFIIDSTPSLDMRPEYLFEIFPDAQIQGSPWTFTKYSILNQEFNNVLSAWAQKVAEIVSDYDAAESMMFHNEPELFSAYLEQYVEPWQNYLKAKYSSIEELNQTYGDGYAYEKFEDVLMPRNFERTPLFYDYKDFNDNLLQDFHKWLYSELKSDVPELKYHVKHLAYLNGSYRVEEQYEKGADNYELIADTMDYNGFDDSGFHMPPEGKDVGQKTTTQYVAWMDFVSSLSEKPGFNMENHILNDRPQLINEKKEGVIIYDDRDATHVGTQVWNSAVHCVGAQVAWLWDLRSYNMPWTNPQYANSDFTLRPNCLLAVSKAAMDLNRLSYEVTALQNAKRDIGLLYSNVTTTYQGQESTVAVIKCYEDAIFSGQRVMFVADSKPQNMNDCKLLIVPKYTTNVKADMLESVKAYLDNGGKVLLMDENALKYDEYNKPHDQALVEYIHHHPNTDKVTQTVNQKIRDMGLSEVVLTDAETGEKVDNVEWSYTEHEGKMLVNVVNHATEGETAFKILYHGKPVTGSMELRAYEQQGETVTVKACDSILLQFDL